MGRFTEGLGLGLGQGLGIVLIIIIAATLLCFIVYYLASTGMLKELAINMIKKSFGL
jgi:hypothetical protein